ncbi:MAG: hypothetical protein ACYC5Y_09045 [Symbiobacteriia bacterium]
MTVVKDMVEIGQAVCRQVWDVLSVNDNEIRALSPKVLLPKLRNSSERISEKEARVIYCAQIERANELFYSIETPTAQTYVQSGTTPMSARSDLSPYRFERGLGGNSGGGFTKVANVEFKAHNAEKGRIKKDVEKLLCEGLPGIW